MQRWNIAVPAWLLLGAAALPAQALQVEHVSPRGTVQQAAQVVVRTQGDAVPLGQPQAAAPASVQCTPAAQGTGRWNNAREWVWQFAQPVAPGTRCSISTRSGFEAVDGSRFTRPYSATFEVAGPALLQTWPATYEPVDEQQVWVLQLNGAATPQSLREHVHCRAQDVGERIPVQLLDSAQRTEVLQALHLDKAARQAPDTYVALRCARRLSAGSTVQLVYGAGVQMASGVRNREALVQDYEVRPAFSAELRCERERASAGCMPIRPLRVQFSAPVPRAMAQQARLTGDGVNMAPQFDADEGQEGAVQSLHFAAPLPPLAQLQLTLPDGLVDDAGRPLANASAFPLKLKLGDSPALAKFAAAPFGVLERYAEGREAPAMLPVTVRHIEGMEAAPTTERGAQIRSLRLSSDADLMHWWHMVQRYDSGSVERAVARKQLRMPLPAPVDEEGRDYVAVRSLSLLQGQSGVQTVPLPQAPKGGAARPFEVVGIPLREPGLHVVEIESPRLGDALLDERLGSPRSMFVRTAALVTNLSVHLKLGKENSAVWVTSLDAGQPVAGARVQVRDCSGRSHGEGTTGPDGVLQLPALTREAPYCDDNSASGNWWVSARQGDDVAFVWSDWQRGIEPWRFELPTGWGTQARVLAHTVMDRSLLRAGETLSMKHFVRHETAQGLALPQRWPTQAIITHVGSGQQYELPLQWQPTASGTRNAHGQFAVPAAAKLGLYTVAMRWPSAEGDDDAYTGDVPSGEFRVEAFRLPVLQGQVQPQASGPLVQPEALPVQVSLNYLNGGPAGGHAVQVSALLRPHAIDFARWPGYSFAPPQSAQAREAGDSDDGAEDAAAATGNSRLLLDKHALRLNTQGQGELTLPAMDTAQAGAQQLELEATFADPNGEVQTLRSQHTVWPAQVLPGIRTGDWMVAQRRMRWQALAVDTQGQPQAGVPLVVHAVLHSTTTTRKRLVGGFYSYDNQRHTQALGEVCRGTSDARGLLLCEASLTEAGEVELIVTATDSAGRTAQAADSVWVTQRGELWFGGQDHDRMDLLADKASYAPGETAQLQVRMPFREATALVTVEREGVLHSEVVQLTGKDPTVRLQVQPGWGPNVFVSVLALRGRLTHVPWYSFFTWGYQAPRQWWQAFWQGNKDVQAPTAMVDLSKPSFRLGAAELRVQDPSQQLTVTVQADKPRYQVREQARITVRATRADGQPAAGAQVALAAVDQALLELAPNTSWQLHDGLWQRRDWNVETATAQMQVVGRRHYGRKAAPPGGGGGRAPTRELLDTLLLWQPALQLNAQGEAQVTVPLNDSLSRFAVVAVADDGVQRFGTGRTDIDTQQDVQLISGLPPVVREGDQLQASLTVRNTTGQPMRLDLTASASLHAPQRWQQVDIPAGQARELWWPVQVAPDLLAQHGAAAAEAGRMPWVWTLTAKDATTGAQDSMDVPVQLLSAVPVTVQQATLVQLPAGQPVQQALAWPQGALPGQGGVKVSLSAQLVSPTQAMAGLQTWWSAYPHACLEQTVGRAIGLGDTALWARTMEQLPAYLDDDGLAMYFPAQGGARSQGSDVLTAHLLRVAHTLRQLDQPMALPAAAQQRMENALIALVSGKLERPLWRPSSVHLDLEVRKLAAVAALAAVGKATPQMLESVQPLPSSWPTHAVLDWAYALQHLPGVPQQAQHLEAAWQELRSRLHYSGTQLGFSTEAADRWWWHMQSPEVNAAQLLLASVDQPSWDAERARLVTGLLARSQQGHWGSTTANTWADLALRRFSQRYERTPVQGTTRVQWGSAKAQEVAWQAAPAAVHFALPKSASAMPSAPMRLTHDGSGQPWAALQVLAAVPRTQAVNMGYGLRKTITPVQQAQPGRWQRGDIVRVQLEVDNPADMTWVALSDPIPAGATVLGSGLGRDSAIATQGEGVQDSGPSPTFVERGQDSWRAYWQYLPVGRTTVSYTLRLNSAGQFALPPSRVEALYAPERWGEWPNAAWQVQSQVPSQVPPAAGTPSL